MLGEYKANGAAPRVMAYCHDSVGLGHLRRTLSICERIGRDIPLSSFLVATGTPYAQLLNPAARIDFLKLPALTKRPDGTYQSKFLGLSLDQLIRCRGSLLIEAVRSLDPQVLLVDKAPLGVCRELVPALRWLRANRPDIHTIFGMRDIEDDAACTVARWRRDGVPEILEQCYDEIWVYGAQSIYDVVREYQLSPAIAAKLRYVGYIARPLCGHMRPKPRPNKSVLVTVGGGTDGERVLAGYLAEAAARVAEMDASSTMVGGPDLPADARDRLRTVALGTPNTHWVDFEPCMQCRMLEADVVVTMGGYNSLCEVLTVGKPALVIPRTTPRLEQKIRAELWQRLGLVRMVNGTESDPAGLASRVVEMLERPPSAQTVTLDMQGLDHVAARFRALLFEEPVRAAALPM